MYEESLMEEWLAVVGKRTFVKYYFDFKMGRATLLEFSKSSAYNRILAAGQIFKNGYHKAALQYIASSKSVARDTALLAQAIYNIETY